jgi:hypothetical protein
MTDADIIGATKNEREKTGEERNRKQCVNTLLQYMVQWGFKYNGITAMR